MSAIGSIGGAGSPPGVNGFSELTSEEFIQIMFAELTNQDPFEPSDSKAMLDQLASLRAIESDLEMGERLESLVTQNEFASAATLVGQVVSGVNLNGQRVLDLVVSVSKSDDGPVLNLFDGSRMPFAWVEEVLGPLEDNPDEPDEPDEPGEPDDPIYGTGETGAGGAEPGGSADDERHGPRQLPGVTG